MTSTFTILAALRPYLRRYRRPLLVGMAILVVNVAVFTSIPYILKLAIDALSTAVTRQRLFNFALLLLLAVLLRGVLQYFQRLILINVSRQIEYDLRNDILARLEQLSLSYFQRTRTGDLMARATNDLNAVRNMVGPGLMYSAYAVVLFLGVLAILFRIDARLTLLVFLPAPFVSLAVQWFGKRIHERFERIQSMFSSLATRVEENLAGLRVIRAYAREQREIASFDDLNRDYVRRNLRLVLLSGAFDPMLQLLLGLAFVLVLWFGGRAVLAQRISLGSFVAFNAYMMQMSFPMVAMGWVINLVQRGSASLARIQELLDEVPAIADGPTTDASVTTVRGAIELRGLDFAYLPGRPVLAGLDLCIPAGATVALVGPTGAGKTTLANLIPRLAEAPPGTLLLDGRPIRDFPLAVLRRHIGLVPQETFLFSDTLQANIAFGRPDADLAAVIEAADIAGLSSDVGDFPDGFQTRVGERGLTLSGGQKQRVALARALLRQPRLLILDDALASVDTVTEERILQRLLEDRSPQHRRTTLLISHRVSTIRNADLIIVLDRGRIAEQGTHSALLGRGGLYAELYEKQLLEEELQRVD